ncbi:hypothetical protein OBG91_11575 [Lactococcus lactis]|nr:hypothetical protein [Lactococcus lactis]
MISEKPQTEEESQISINEIDNVTLSEEDNSWEKQLLEASEKELLAGQSDEQKEEQTFSYSSSEDTKVPTFSEPTITDTDVVETFDSLKKETLTTSVKKLQKILRQILLKEVKVTSRLQAQLMTLFLLKHQMLKTISIF